MKQNTLTTGESLQVDISVPSQVEISGTFGTVVLTSSTGLVIERTTTGAETFKSEMQDMKFELTIGAGPVVIGIQPLMGDTNSKPKVFRTIVS